ncbi:MAG: LacI family transcriptional regulator [Rhodobacteraceae bacterium]|nr:LacI family transcriptional regulator [Paracoccaceae bacterium]
MNTKPTGKRPTLRTVAEETGFAVATVSRALADDPKIAQKTRDEVARVAARLNYVPDRAAQRLRTGRTKVISVLLNLDHEFLGFSDEILFGVMSALQGTDFAISVMPETQGPKRFETVQKIVRQQLSDGVILTQTEPFDDRVRVLSEAGMPFVTHGRTEFTTPHAWVDFDNEVFARGAVERLVSQGRSRLCMILPDPRYTFGQHLRYGFLSAVRAAGVEYELPDEVTLDSTPDEIAAFIRKRQAAPNPPDGHICVGEASALATTSALQDCGVRPEIDVSVLTKQASPLFEHVRPQIQTVFEDLRETGKHLGRLLLERIDGTPPDDLHVLLTPEA